MYTIAVNDNQEVTYPSKLILNGAINFKSTVEANHQKDTYPNSTKAMGWYLQGYEQVSANDKTWKLYLGKEQKAFDDITVGKPTGWSGEGLGLETIPINSIFSFYNSVHFINGLVVQQIDTQYVITVKDISEKNANIYALPPDNNAGLAFFRYGLYVSGKIEDDTVIMYPDGTNLGIVDLTLNTTTVGYANINVGNNGNIIGKSNKNFGQNNLTIGTLTTNTGYASIVSGVRNEMYSEQSGSVGYANVSESAAIRSFVAGCQNKTSVANSFTAGLKLINNTPNSSVLGQWNKTTNNTLLVIGKGTSESTRSNALELNKNGNLSVSGSVSAGGILHCKNNIQIETSNGTIYTLTPSIKDGKAVLEISAT